MPTPIYTPTQFSQYYTSSAICNLNINCFSPLNPLLCNFYMSSFFIFLFPLVFLVVFTFVFLPVFIFLFNFKCLKFSIFFIAFDCQVSRFQNTTRPYIISIIIILFLSCPRFSWFSYFSCLLCLLLFLVCFYLLVSFCLNYFVLFVFCVCFGINQWSQAKQPSKSTKNQPS